MKRPLSLNIKTARKKKGWSQELTARKIGIKQKTYAKYEETINPPWELMPLIMEVFEIKEQDMYPFIYNDKFFNEK